MKYTLEIDLPEKTVQDYEQAGIDWKAQARKMVEDSLPADAPSYKQEKAEAKRAAAIAWLRSMAAEAEQMTDEEKEEAERDLEELKRNLNATRAENGERLLFP